MSGRGCLVGLDVGTSGRQGNRDRSPRGPCSPSPRSPTHSRRPTRAGRSRIRRTGGRRVSACSIRAPRERRHAGRDRALRPDARARRPRCRRTGCSARRSCGTTSGPRTQCEEIERTIGLERLISLTGNRALTGFTAPKLLWLREHEPDVYGAYRPDRAAQGLRAAASVRRARDRRLRRVRDAAARRRRGGAGATTCSSALGLDPPGCRAVLESPEVSGEHQRRRARRRRRR